MKQPATVVVLAMLAVIMGVWSVINIFRYLGIFQLATLGPVEFFGVSLIGAIFSGLTAAIWFWAAGKVWNLQKQGLVFLTLVAAVYLIFDILAILGGTSLQSLLPSIFLSGVVLLLSSIPPTRHAFDVVN